MNEINEFLLNIKNWEDKLPISSFNQDNNSELSKITSLQKSKNIKHIIDTWKKKSLSKHFEVYHPHQKKIKSRAIYSVKLGMANFILMNDKTNKNPWIIGQCTNFIDLVISPNGIYKTSLFDGHALFLEMRKISEIDENNFIFRDIEWGFTLGQSTPYHFFYDQYKYLIELDLEKKIKNNGAFYLTPNIEEKIISSDCDFVGFFPNCIGGNHIRNGKASMLNKKMEEIIYKDAIKNIKTENNSDRDLVLWFGITGRKRCWTDQVNGLHKIIKHLTPYFENIEVYIDGITARHGINTISTEDNEIYNLIETKLSGICNVSSLVGKNYKEKIQVCENIDIFVANAGSGAIVPLRFCKKPGVLHSNTRLFTFPDSYPETVKIVENKYITDIKSEKNRQDMDSYIIPWQCICNYLSDLILTLKNIKIEKHKTPFRTEQPITDTKKAFHEITNRIKPNHESADILFNVAFSFEKVGDYAIAIKLVEKALELRPHGPILKKKLMEYKTILKKQGIKL